MDEKLIEDYIQGKLPDEQRKDFEKQLNADPKLAAEVAYQAGVKEGIQELEYEKTLIFLKEVEKENPQQTMRNFTYWAAAASVIIIASVYFIIQSIIFNTEDLYNEYYYAPKSLVNDQRRGENNESKSTRAFELYDSQQYEDAVKEFENLISNNEDDELEFFAAICYLNTSKENQALQYFDQISENTKYYDDGLWYSALTYLKIKKRKKASEKLRKLLASNSEYQEEAGRLLEDL